MGNIGLVLLMYGDDPCRICGHKIDKDDISMAVFAGYSKCNKSRTAHGKCWKENPDKSQWAYPEDEDMEDDR